MVWGLEGGRVMRLGGVGVPPPPPPHPPPKKKRRGKLGIVRDVHNSLVSSFDL